MGDTWGVVNEMVSKVRVKSAFGHSGPEIPTREYCVLTKGGDDPTSITSRPGDSGNVFLNVKGEVTCQMFAGGIRTLQREGVWYDYEVTYVTPISKILTHLEEALGEPVEVFSILTSSAGLTSSKRFSARRNDW